MLAAGLSTLIPPPPSLYDYLTASKADTHRQEGPRETTSSKDTTLPSSPLLFPPSPPTDSSELSVWVVSVSLSLLYLGVPADLFGPVLAVLSLLPGRHADFELCLEIHDLQNVPLVSGTFSVEWKFKSSKAAHSEHILQGE